MMENVINQYLQYLCGADHVLRDEPLWKWTTFRVGGPAKFMVTVDDKKKLSRLISALNYLEYPYFVLGLGANVLASDGGFDGVIIRLNFKEIYHNDQFVYADAGAKLGVVINYARDHGLSGLEWATGIPATIGGGVYMNCGAFGSCMADVVAMVDIMDEHGAIKTLNANQIEYSYRHSVFMEQPAVIVGAYLRLQPGDPAQIGQKMAEILQSRQHHPKEPSAGSTFKRARDGFYVGREIEKLGLKGFQIGGAKVSEKHAGFIVNCDHATCDDVLKVIYHVQDTVEAATGVVLETEVIFLGKID